MPTFCEFHLLIGLPLTILILYPCSDYGAATCIKYEIDGGFDFPGTGRYYVACDSVDCCKDQTTENKPDVKQWDIMPTSWWKST